MTALNTVCILGFAKYRRKKVPNNAHDDVARKAIPARNTLAPIRGIVWVICGAKNDEVTVSP
jgi:hypothetical protein